MKDIARMLRDLWRGDRRLAAALVLSYTLVLYGLYLLKPARDSLFLSFQSAADLPLAFIVTAALAIPVSLAYGRVSRTWSQARLLGLLTVIVTSGLLLWWWLLQRPSPVITYLFYAWTGIVGGVVSSQFWLLGNAICDTRQAKHLFPLLGLGGIAGAVLGSWSADRAASWLGMDPLDLVLITSGVWALAVGFAAIALRMVDSPAPSRPAVERGRTQPVRELMKDIVGSRHLLLIIGMVAVAMLVSTFADFLFKTAAADAYPDRGDLLGYLGRFYAAMNLAGFILQLLLTSRLLRSLGVGGALLVMPSLLAIGAGALVIAPGLLAASILRGSEMSLKYSLDKTSRELVYLPLPLGLKRQVKVFVDTFVERGSRGLAGLLLLLATTVLALPMRAIAAVVIVLLLVWIVFAVAMRRQYIQSFRRAVARREISREDLRTSLRDPQAVELLTASLGSDQPREVAYALAMLRSVPASDLPPDIARLLDHPAPQVRQRAIALAVEAPLEDCSAAALRLLDDPEPETGRLAAEYLHQAGGNEALIAALDGGETAQASILDYLSHRPAQKKVPALVTRERVEALLAPATEVDHRLQIAAAAYLGRTTSGGLDDLLSQLDHAPKDVIGAAISGLGRQVDRRHLADLGRLLGDRRRRPWVRRALRAYGPVAVPLLVEIGCDRSLDRPTRRAALRVLARAAYQRTVDVILSRLDRGDDDDRAVLVPVLLRMREQRPSLRFPRGSVDRLLRLETQQTRHMLLTVARLGPVLDDDSDRLLRRALGEIRRLRMERVFQLLALRYDVRDIMGAWLRVSNDDDRRQADAREFLENLLSPHHRVLVERTLVDIRQPAAQDREQALLSLLATTDPWLRSCAIWSARDDRSPALQERIRELATDPDPLVAETARVALDLERRTVTMLTTIEKAILLERVQQFDEVDSERLAAIAAIAEERQYADGDRIYRAGDLGNAMFLVVDGAVSLRRGDQEIARAGQGEAFGIWSLFEPEPRMVDALADGDGRVLRIAREDIADLMAEDVAVAQSLLRSIARRLRELASRAA